MGNTMSGEKWGVRQIYKMAYRMYFLGIASFKLEAWS